MAWYPHYEALLIIPTDDSLHNALTRSTVVSSRPVLKDLPADAKGDLWAPLFSLRPRSPRRAAMPPVEKQDYRGALIRGGLRLD